MLKLTIVKRTNPQLLYEMSIHYSKPKGFVGRNICYAIHYNGVHYGHIVGGSATRFLPNRDEFAKFNVKSKLNQVVNNIFFHIEPLITGYPIRNFSTAVLLEFEKQIIVDWKLKYNDDVLLLESLVELPRTGECYRRAGYTNVGQTKGYTCKRISGKSTDGWSGKRVWNTKQLRPKYVFLKLL